MTKICVPVSGGDAKAARKMADKAISSGADLVEIRADLIKNSDIGKIRHEFSDILRKSIITLRSKSEGGASDLSVKERLDWIREAIGIEPAFVDLELDNDRRLIDESQSDKSRIIVSKHIFSNEPVEGVSKILRDCCSLGGIGKVAVKVEDVIRCTDILAKVDRDQLSNHAIMTMGPGSEISRALAASIGSQIVYCALSDNEKVASGQLLLGDQLRVNSADSIIVGLIGHPLGHTLSPAMHNAAFESIGLPGAYLTFDIPDSSQVKDFIRTASKLGVRGFNVTIPYKEVAFSSVDSIDNDARRAGAVNTIVADEKGELRGFNTDIHGFSEALRANGYNPRNKRALIVGAGGASRAAIIALWKMGAKIVIANRTPERAEELVRSMRVFIKTLSLDALEKEKPFNLLVNATPVGMSGFDNASIIPDDFIMKADAVMDMVYNPLETPLVASARKHNVKAIPGLDMLLYQGAKAFEIWTGKEAPVESMRKRLLEAMKK
ncbi:MAG: shikimate dehydrogenase [Thermoplasmata archaeon]|nr:shikimate dehydrogenase [Thermoplasmata archaeon]